MSPHIHTESRSVGHLPLVRSILDHLGILSVIEGHCPRHDLSRVSDAECIAVMILNILSGRVALYAMETWCARTDTELLIGEGCEPDAFNDTRLAVALDHIDLVGSDTIMGGVIERYLQTPNRPTEYSVHSDTSSVSLYGAYEGQGDPFITYGYSKDKRPDLKQLIFGLSIHGAAGIPLLTDIVAGNTSDATVNRDVLSRLSALLPDTDEVTVVADCKAVDAITIGRVLDEGLHLVSLVPDAYSARGTFIDAAWSACPELDDWPELVRKAGRLKADPDKVYRGWSTVEPFKVQRRRPAEDGEGLELYDTTAQMRLLVVHSTSLAGRFDKALPRKLTKEHKRLDDFIKKRGSKGFSCEQDARDAAAKVVAKLRLLSVETTITATQIPLKRPQRGRPRKDEPPPIRTVWTVAFSCQPNETAITQARHRGSCFMLVTDHTDESLWPDQRILNEYRRQYIVENHTGFRWLKSEAQVSPMFLKTTQRIRAFGLVLVLALMARNFIQYRLRGELRRRRETLPHPFTKKEEPKLTFEMAMNWFMGIHATKVSIDDSPLVRAEPRLPPTAERILSLLAVPRNCFSRPPTRPGHLHPP